jgi:hypothetical protein
MFCDFTKNTMNTRVFVAAVAIIVTALIITTNGSLGLIGSLPTIAQEQQQHRNNNSNSNKQIKQ